MSNHLMHFLFPPPCAAIPTVVVAVFDDATLGGLQTGLDTWVLENWFSHISHLKLCGAGRKFQLSWQRFSLFIQSLANTEAWFSWQIKGTSVACCLPFSSSRAL